MRWLLDDLKHLRGELAVTLAGLATSVATAAVVVFGILVLRIDVSSITVWIVIPVGAIGAGMIAASGYGLAASRIDHRPGFQLLVNMVLIAASTFLLIQYGAYRTARFADGTLVASYVPFWRYYLSSIADKQIAFRTNLSNPMGGLGPIAYGLEAIKFAGFLIGAALRYRDLWRSKPDLRVASRRQFARARSRTINCKRCNSDVLLRTQISMEPIEAVQRFLDSVDAQPIGPTADHEGIPAESALFSVRTAICTSCGLDHCEVVTHYQTHTASALFHKPEADTRQLADSHACLAPLRDRAVPPTGLCPVCHSLVVFDAIDSGARRFCVNGHAVAVGDLDLNK